MMVGLPAVSTAHALLASAGGSPAPGALRTSLAEAFIIQKHPISGDIEWLGSIIIWVLILMSMACIGMLGARALDTKRERFIPSDPPPPHGDELAQRQALQADGSVFAIGALAALDAFPRSRDAMLEAAEEAVERATVERIRRLDPLSIAGNVAPMIGLFGTVYGMILAFWQIVLAGGSPDPVQLAAGIGTALVTTFWGLIVAIPALVGHSVLRNRTDAHTLHAWDMIERFIAAHDPPTPAPLEKAAHHRTPAAAGA